MRAERLAIGLLGAFGLLLAPGCGWNPFGGQKFEALITDAAGLPLPGAVASFEGGAAITDEAGRVALADVRGRVWVQKTGYAPLSVDANAGSVALAKREGPLKIVWDERHGASVPMKGLMGHLAGRGFEIVSLRSGAPPPDADALVLSCPAYFDETSYAQYMRAAHAGTKLVLLGEWGGFDGIDLAALTSIASKAGISFESGQVRTYSQSGQPQAWLPIKDSRSPFASDLPAGVTLFTAGVLQVSPPARVALTSDDSAIRILRWDVGSQPLAAIGPLGRSQVVAIADSSLFSDELSPDGQPQWQAADNPRFAENVLAW